MDKYEYVYVHVVGIVFLDENEIIYLNKILVSFRGHVGFVYVTPFYNSRGVVRPKVIVPV